MKFPTFTRRGKFCLPFTHLKLAISAGNIKKAPLPIKGK